MTFGLDAVITRGSNTYGPYQHPEKLIPLFTTNALAGEPLPMYGDGMQVRDWLHVSDHAAGIEFVLRHGEPGEAYNVAGEHELPNREVIGRLLEATGRDWSLVRIGPGPARPRPPLRDGRLEARGARLAGAASRSSTACPRRSPGTATTPTWVAAARVRRLGRLLRGASTARGSPAGRRRAVDERRAGDAEAG